MTFEKDAWSQLWLQFDAGTTPSTTHLDPDFMAQINPKDRILDIGCGYGRGVQMFAEKAAQVVGVDINQAEIELARCDGLPNTSFDVMSGDQLEFADNTFDKVSLMGVIGGVSLQMRKQILTEAKRVTRPGGLVYVSEYPIDHSVPGSYERYTQGEQDTGEYGALTVAVNGILFICKHFDELEVTNMFAEVGLIDLSVRMPVVTRYSISETDRTYQRQVLCAWARKP